MVIGPQGKHQQEPPGGGPQPEQAADELAPAAAAQAVHVGRRAPTASRRSLDDIVVVQRHQSYA